jgi:hypothetical protein
MCNLCEIWGRKKKTVSVNNINKAARRLSALLAVLFTGPPPPAQPWNALAYQIWSRSRFTV